MVKHSWIGDDDVLSIIPVFLGTHKDVAKAGVIIRVLTPKDYLEQLIKLL